LEWIGKEIFGFGLFLKNQWAGKPEVSPQPGFRIKIELESLRTTDALETQWLLETSTDPDALLAATKVVRFVEWPSDLEISTTLDLLRQRSVLNNRSYHSQENDRSVSEIAKASMKAYLHLHFTFRESIEVPGWNAQPRSASLEDPLLVRHWSRMDPDLAVLSYAASNYIVFVGNPEDAAYHRNLIQCSMQECDLVWISHLLPYIIILHLKHRMGLVWLDIIGRCLAHHSPTVICALRRTYIRNPSG